MAGSEFPAYVARNIEQSHVEDYAASAVSGEVLLVGDLCIWDSGNGWVERSGADPSAGTIIGLAEVSSVAARLITPDNKIPIRTLDGNTVVAMSSTTDYVEATHRFVEYGVTRSSAGRWQVDVGKTTTSARVVVIGGIPQGFGPGQNNVWFVKFLAEFLANDGIDS